MNPRQIVEEIQRAYAARNLVIPSGSELAFLLQEIERFHTGAQDLQQRSTDSQTDEAAISVGEDYLRALRLAESLQRIRLHRARKITETLKTLGSFSHGNDIHSDQFNESEYELHMASQFVGLGQKISFVIAQPSEA